MLWLTSARSSFTRLGKFDSEATQEDNRKRHLFPTILIVSKYATGAVLDFFMCKEVYVCVCSSEQSDIGHVVSKVTTVQCLNLRRETGSEHGVGVPDSSFISGWLCLSGGSEKLVTKILFNGIMLNSTHD